MDFIINDSTPDHMFMDPNRGTGLDLSGRPEGFAYAGVATPFPPELLIPESEYQARIEERVALKNAIPDLCDQAGLPCKDQERTNYCWINAPTHTIEIGRVVQNQPKVILSAASAGGPIKNFRNVGGWGKEGIEWIAEHGLVPEGPLWPHNAIERKYWTEDNKKLAMSFRQLEWIEAEPGNLQQMFSLILRNIPCALGFAWWSHEVTGVDVKWMDGGPVLVIRNSWGMGWGDRGYSIIQGRRMKSDDVVAPTSVLAT